MEKTKSKSTATAPVEYRENPRTNEKIDAWIKNNPDRFKFFDEMPHERAVRKLVLNEVEKYERMQKMNSGIMQKLNDDPEAKQAFEILLKRVARRPSANGRPLPLQNTFFNLAHRATTVPKRKVPEVECAQEDKIHAGQRLAAFATAGAPFAVPAATYAPSLQKPQDFAFPH